MVEKSTTLDHLKYYISLTQKANLELKKGNKELYEKLFNEANDELKIIGWDSFIMNGK